MGHGLRLRDFDGLDAYRRPSDPLIGRPAAAASGYVVGRCKRGLKPGLGTAKIIVPP